MEKDKVKDFVKKRYGEIAQTEQSCCCSSSCCGPSTKNISKEIGYSQQDLENVPDSAILGLGCGNPVALANLKEGETVLGLGLNFNPQTQTDNARMFILFQDAKLFPRRD